MADVRIGDKMVGDGHPCFVIAEVGINHNGSLETAKKLVDVAADAGCDAVKFQKRTVDVVYSPEELAKPRESIFGETNGDLKFGLELDGRSYKEIARYCGTKGILWFASCWDEGSVDFIENYNPACHKIASASLTDDDLLRHIRATGRPVILSTGMSTMEQVEHAVEVLGHENLIILHTVSTYPADYKDLNLSVMSSLQKRFPDIPIGYSGHEIGISLSVCAVVMGACVIERHITLDRTMWGSDHAASLEPGGIKRVVRNIREFEAARGDGIKRVLEAEIPIMKKLRRK